MMKKITILLLALLLLTGCSKKPAATETPDATETQTQRPGNSGGDNVIDFGDLFIEETQGQENVRPTVSQGPQPSNPSNPSTPTQAADPEDEDPQPSTEATDPQTPNPPNSGSEEKPGKDSDTDSEEEEEENDSTQETTATPPPPVIGSDGYYGSILRP